MSGIDLAAVEAAAKAIHARYCAEPPMCEVGPEWQNWEDAHAALAAALPHLRRSLADELYGAINLAADRQPREIALGMYAAARLVRGDEP